MVVGAILTCFAVLACPAAWADKRVALVVGNSSYQAVAQLPNPANDARAFAEMLKDAHFDSVDLRTDLGIDAFRQALRDFAALAADADTAVFFYAGHGMEIGGTNLLVPVDAKLRTDLDAEDETVSVDRVLRALEPVKQLRLVVLDACRDNPFVASMKHVTASRSVSRGLQRIEGAPADTMIAFATEPGSVAGDGDGHHSPFTTALLRDIAVPGLDLRIALGQVRDDVLKATGGKQRPYVTGSLGGSNQSLIPQQPAAGADAPRQAEIAVPVGSGSVVPPAVVAPPPQEDPEIAYNKAVLDNTKEAFEKLLRDFPNHPKKEVVLALYQMKTEEGVWKSIEQTNDPVEKLALIKMLLKVFPKGVFAERAGVMAETLLRDKPEAPPAPPPDNAQRDFDIAQAANTSEAWTAFISQHPGGPLAELAHFKLREVTSAARAASTPTPPSFDCARAGTVVERQICTSSELSAQDRQMADLFRQVLGRSANAFALQASQADWMRSRDACADRGSSEAITGCVALAYTDRIAALMPAPTPPSFNCARAGSVVERQICASSDLAAQDRQMADLFRQALGRSGNSADLQGSQADWLRSRNACGARGSDEAITACVATSYAARIAALERLPARPAAIGSYHYIDGINPASKYPWVALRNAPNSQAPWSDTHLINGMLLTLLDQSGEWDHVQLPSGETGWANSRYVQCCKGQAETPSQPAPSQASYHYVTGIDRKSRYPWLALRNAPNSQAPWSDTHLEDQTLLTVIEQNGDWYHVRLLSGETGWANARFITCCKRLD